MTFKQLIKENKSDYEDLMEEYINLMTSVVGSDLVYLNVEGDDYKIVEINGDDYIISKFNKNDKEILSSGKIYENSYNIEDYDLAVLRLKEVIKAIKSNNILKLEEN